MKFQDYYKTLGVDRQASQADIQRAFRKLARKYHPDLNKSKDAEEKFKALNEANEVLGDPQKRSKYDQLGSNWNANQDFQPPPGFNSSGQTGFAFNFTDGSNSPFASDQDLSGFSDFFKTIFANKFSAADFYPDDFSHSKAMPKSQQQQALCLEISLVDLYFNKKKLLRIKDAKNTSSSFEVTIPAGVKDGSIIRLPKATTQDDILIKLKLIPDKRFSVDNFDLYCDLAITPWEAALGTKIPFELLDGKIMLQIKAGSQNLQKLRIPHKGLTKNNKERGDLFVQLKIAIPTQLSEQEKDLLKQLAAISKFNPRGVYGHQ